MGCCVGVDCCAGSEGFCAGTVDLVSEYLAFDVSKYLPSSTFASQYLAFDVSKYLPSNIFASEYLASDTFASPTRSPKSPPSLLFSVDRLSGNSPGSRTFLSATSPEWRFNEPLSNGVSGTVLTPLLTDGYVSRFVPSRCRWSSCRSISISVFITRRAPTVHYN